MRYSVALREILNMEFREINIKKDENCKLFGDDPDVKELIDYEIFFRIVN
jgi:hypothetical protein